MSEATSQLPITTGTNLAPAHIYDLFCFVKAVCGSTTGTSEPPAVPANAEQFVMDMGGYDSMAVWVVDGWPVAASDEMTMTHWCISGVVDSELLPEGPFTREQAQAVASMYSNIFIENVRGDIFELVIRENSTLLVRAWNIGPEAGLWANRYIQYHGVKKP